MPYVTPLDRDFITERVQIDERGCWLWQRALDKRGYALIGPGAQERQAHRLSYGLFVGPIPDGLTVDHICFVQNCVNPDHLQLLTLADNVRRKNPRRGAERPAIPTYQSNPATHCKRGHELDSENTVSTQGKRRCRTCINARRRRDRALAT